VGLAIAPGGFEPVGTPACLADHGRPDSSRTLSGKCCWIGGAPRPTWRTVGMYGFVYLNLKGREPQGIVAPEEFESVRDALIARFQG